MAGYICLTIFIHFIIYLKLCFCSGLQERIWDFDWDFGGTPQGYQRICIWVNKNHIPNLSSVSLLPIQFILSEFFKAFWLIKPCDPVVDVK